MSINVLLVDDDSELLEMLAEFLQANGVQVTTVGDGRDAVRRFCESTWDVVVLDVMMPGLNGLDVLTRIRARSSVPIILLTAKGDENDRVCGLNLGADDYVAKPFSSKELLARIRAHSRRHQLYECGSMQRHNIELVPNEFTAKVNGSSVLLTGAEKSILKLLLASGDEPTSRAQIYRVVFGRELSPYDRSLDTHISNLRKKLTSSGPEHPKIQAIRGVGYVLVA